MRLRGILVGNLQRSDIESLVTNRVGESRSLEYKEALPKWNDESKRSFMADVTALANTDGGVLVFGVETERDSDGKDTGIPKTIVGVGKVNLDAEKQRLLNMAKDGVSPSLSGALRFQAIDVPGSHGSILVLGVPHSVLMPHRVVFNKENRFYRRNEAGNYQPDVPELRRMFLEASSWIEEADRWRTDRVARVCARKVYQRISTTRVAFIQILPLGRFGQTIDLCGKREELTQRLLPFDPHGWDHRFNSDGYMTFGTVNGSIDSYSQVFRFGGIEGFSARFTRTVTPSGGGGSSLQLNAQRLEKLVPEYVETNMKVMQDILHQDPPFVVMVGVYGVLGARIPGWDSYQGPSVDDGVDREDIVLPPVVIEDPGVDVRTLLRPVMDVLWQSAGYPGPPVTQR